MPWGPGSIHLAKTFMILKARQLEIRERKQSYASAKGLFLIWDSTSFIIINLLVAAFPFSKELQSSVYAFSILSTNFYTSEKYCKTNLCFVENFEFVFLLQLSSLLLRASFLTIILNSLVVILAEGILGR